MKNITPAMQTHIRGAHTTLAPCVKFKLTDGTILPFTEHDFILPFDLEDGDGVIQYRPDFSFIRSAVKVTAGFAVNQVDLEGLLGSTGITIEDVITGRLNFASVHVFLVNWQNLSTTMGSIPLSEGFIGEVEQKGVEYLFQFKDLLSLYNRTVGRNFTAGCLFNLGDTDCGVQLRPSLWAASTAYTVRPPRDASKGSTVAPTTFNDRYFECSVAGTSGVAEPTWNLTIGGTTVDNTVTWITRQALVVPASVLSVVRPTREFVIDYTGSGDAALFKSGVVTWLSGNNIGTKRPIKTYNDGTGTVILDLPTRLPIQASDTLELSAGCDYTVPDCRDTFDNIERFGGYPHVPGFDLFIRTPNAH